MQKPEDGAAERARSGHERHDRGLDASVQAECGQGEGGAVGNGRGRATQATNPATPSGSELAQPGRTSGLEFTEGRTIFELQMGL